MRQQQEIVLYAVRFPEACRLAVVLFFDDDFFCRKARALENAHRLKAERLYHSFFARIAHKDGAKLAFFQDAAAFVRDLSYFQEKVFHREQGQIAVNVLAVMDDVGIRRVRANQIDRIIRHIQFPGIAVYERNGRRRFKIESALCPCCFDCRRIYVNADKIAPRQPCLDGSRAATDKLIQHGIARLGIAQYHIARNIGRPIAAILCVMRCPLAASKIPSIQSLRFREK